MDEIENAINEARRVSQRGEALWRPSAPLIPPEVTVTPPPADEPKSSPEPLESMSPPEQKFFIARFTVTKTPTNSQSTDTANKTFTIPVTTKVPEQQSLVMVEKESPESSDSTSTPTTPATTITSTTTSTNTPAPATTTTTSTSTPSAKPQTSSSQTSSGLGTEDGGKALGVVGTQTDDMEPQTGKQSVTSLAFLQEALKEIKTLVAPASVKELKLGYLVKLHDNNYCLLCLMGMFLLSLLISFMWMVSILSVGSGPHLKDIRLDSINSLGRTGHLLRQESEGQSEAEVSGAASNVVENAETEGPSDSEEMHAPSLAGADTDEEVFESIGGGEVEMEATESLEDELMEEESDEQPPFIPQDDKTHEQSEDIDSQVLYGEKITNAADIRPMIVRVVYLKAHQCQEGGEVFLSRYVDMYRHLLHFFRVFGTFATVQGRMLESRLLALERYTRGRDGHHYTTLAAMIHFEDVTGKIGSVAPFSGTTIFTCLQRHLQFMSRCLANVLSLSPATSLLHAFSAAYKEILEMHHSWFVENFYLAGIGMLPTKQTALRGIASLQGVTIPPRRYSTKASTPSFTRWRS